MLLSDRKTEKNPHNENKTDTPLRNGGVQLQLNLMITDRLYFTFMPEITLTNHVVDGL